MINANRLSAYYSIADVVAAAASNYECQTGLTTSETDDGGGSNHGLMFLDRQSVQCRDKGVLVQYQLDRGPSKATIYYRYTCCKGSWVQPSESKTFTTSWAEDANDVATLDRNVISCPDGMGLQGFFLERGTAYNLDGKFWRYNVSCAPVRSTKCYLKELPKQDLGVPTDRSNTKHIIFLDRHNVDCADNSIATFMKASNLMTTTGKKCGPYIPDYGRDCWTTYQFQYKVTCCIAQTEENSSEYDYAVVQLMNTNRKECLIFKTDANGGGQAELGPCSAQSSGYTTNKFYAEPTYLTALNQHALKLHPYLDNGVVMDQSITDEPYENVVLSLDAPGIVYESSSNLINFPITNKKLAASNGRWDPTRVQATGGYDGTFFLGYIDFIDCDEAIYSLRYIVLMQITSSTCGIWSSSRLR